MEPLERWRRELAAWRIPDEIAAGAVESPWVLPRDVFVRRARRQRDRPQGPSFELAWEALDPPGTVLDVGAGAGAASLPLAPRCTGLTAVDTDRALLDELAALAGTPVRTVEGRWPHVADQVEQADVVTCHHVIYNAPELDAFVEALTAKARRLVVVETALRHPLTDLNPLWRHFHGQVRADGPTAYDAIAVIEAMGLKPDHQAWSRPPAAEHATFEELVEVSRRRLCLPPRRTAEVAEALAGLRESRPDLGSSGRDLVTVWWTP